MGTAHPYAGVAMKIRSCVLLLLIVTACGSSTSDVPGSTSTTLLIATTSSTTLAPQTTTAPPASSTTVAPTTMPPSTTTTGGPQRVVADLEVEAQLALPPGAVIERVITDGDAILASGYVMKEQTLYVTGWATTATGTAAALWSTTDGTTWQTQTLPNRSFDHEWGREIAAGHAGAVVALGGPVHSGVGAMVTTDMKTWSPIVAIEGSVSGVSADALALYVLQHDEFGTNHTTLARTIDGSEWLVSDPIPVEAPLIRYLHTSAGFDPVAYAGWQDPTLWTFTDGSWQHTVFPDLDSVTAVTDDYVIGPAGSEFIFYRRVSE